MSDTAEFAGRRRSAAWAVWILALAIPIVFVSVIQTLVWALGVFPLFDLTPFIVLALAFLSRRWEGVSTRWFGVAAVLAIAMVVEWLPWYAGLATGSLTEAVASSALVSVAIVTYGAELLALLVLTTVAAVSSIRGLRRETLQRAAEEA